VVHIRWKYPGMSNPFRYLVNPATARPAAASPDYAGGVGDSGVLLSFGSLTSTGRRMSGSGISPISSRSDDAGIASTAIPSISSFKSCK
jgi:hypothetical protein